MSPDATNELMSFAHGPLNAYYYTACIVNGIRFVVQSRDVENSGILSLGEDGTSYYGQIDDIIELNYISGYSVVLFRCKWFKTSGIANEIYVLHNTRSLDITIDVESSPEVGESIARMTSYISKSHGGDGGDRPPNDHSHRLSTSCESSISSLILSSISSSIASEISIDFEDNMEETEQGTRKMNHSNRNEKEIEQEDSNDISTSESSFSIKETPGGSMVWVPNIPENEKPVVGKKYSTLESAMEMYSSYARKSGFDIRLSTQKKNRSGQIRLKFILCNKAFKMEGLDVNTLDKKIKGKQIRSTNSVKTDCKAGVKFRLTKNLLHYEVYEFEERHNHELVPIEQRHLLKVNRKLQATEENFIHQLASTNVGATRAHSMLSGMRGSRDLVHGTTVDFKNFRRDLNMFVGENDAQYLVNKMKERIQHSKDFTFNYRTENTELVSFFWADEIAKCNYKEFGDIVSFDATYDTNKYKMSFVPFTGIDNHRRCVTFGAGMILNEDTISFKWLLECFLEAFKKQPTIIVTDQDPAVKKAVEEVFSESKHRLCMWHITNKLPVKISSNILQNTDFRKTFHRIVWNIYLGPIQFEEKWKEMLEEYQLSHSKWLNDMYNIRERWIPAFFKNLEMCGLMRTSSRSESENSFFSSFTHQGDTLVQFMFSFDAAMEKQRYIQEMLDHHSRNTVPKFKTELQIERHASKLYTRTIFKLMQIEITESVWRCSHKTIVSEEGIEVYYVNEKRHVNETEDEEIKRIQLYTTERRNEFKVLHNKIDGSTVCICEHYLRLGILCRHALYVLRCCGIEEIPSQYVNRRWTKDLIPSEMRKRRNLYSDSDVEAEKLAQQAVTGVDFCIRSLMNDKE
ncbi:hypothetical protein QVD17_30906 [Tagetes erecta]|uniref:SWIM-type domain-containing protein n=1 Tax=Tagetes erecta TaxID=13708 RepID=A0AAD8K2E5_TARER|nr:hypothetical protein QVD17_30906 [Tagetes erecta]